MIGIRFAMVLRRTPIDSDAIDRARLEACARQIADAGRELGALGWTPATSSNSSMRLDAGHAAVTISGRDKGRLGVDDIMVVDLAGRAVGTDARPSAETALHVQVYRRFPDAGAVLRCLNSYEHMEGGSITLALSGASDGPMKGQVDTSNFFVVNEPKLASIVSSTPANATRSLNQAVKGDIDTSRVPFERGYSEIEKGTGYLKLKNGLLRGPTIGTTFQGTLYDQNNNMDMTGTFMPIYGLNRIFGELPIVGALLGNGRDRGLIGVTYRLRGDANKPALDINPLSVIAPGLFRSIFEFR